MYRFIKRKILKPEDRFWKYVCKGPECWLWIGAKLPTGYGVFGIGTFKNKKTISAHRFSYEIKHGKIPNKYMILHKCDNPGCVNPEHLFPGTAKENMMDCIQKKRNAFGERQGLSKLTEREVLEIRRIYKPYVVTRRFLMKEYKVSWTAISGVVDGVTWKHLL